MKPIVRVATLRSVMEELGSWHQACAIGEAEMHFCIVRDDDGMWRVFWQERGNRIQPAEFEDEQDACLEFMRLAGSGSAVDEWLVARGRTDLVRARG